VQDDMKLLGALGLTLPSPAYILGLIVFGVAGLAAYYDGKRHGRSRERWLGVALMLYPYAVHDTWLLYVLGAALCAGVWFARGAA
jgi:hypothetical protein